MFDSAVCTRVSSTAILFIFISLSPKKVVPRIPLGPWTLWICARKHGLYKCMRGRQGWLTFSDNGSRKGEPFFYGTDCLILAPESSLLPHLLTSSPVLGTFPFGNKNKLEQWDGFGAQPGKKGVYIGPLFPLLRPAIPGFQRHSDLSP